MSSILSQNNDIKQIKKIAGAAAPAQREEFTFAGTTSMLGPFCAIEES